MSDNEGTIPVGSGLKAFAKGVFAGEDALTKLAGMKDESAQRRAAYYWLVCGAALATQLPDADDDDQMQFIAGAATRQPSSAPVQVTLTNLDNAAFGDDEDGDEAHDEQRRHEVARLVHEAANKIKDGFEDGKLYDANGNLVGTFSYSPWS